MGSKSSVDWSIVVEVPQRALPGEDSAHTLL